MADLVTHRSQQWEASERYTQSLIAQMKENDSVFEKNQALYVSMKKVVELFKLNLPPVQSLAKLIGSNGFLAPLKSDDLRFWLQILAVSARMSNLPLDDLIDSVDDSIDPRVRCFVQLGMFEEYIEKEHNSEDDGNAGDNIEMGCVQCVKDFAEVVEIAEWFEHMQPKMEKDRATLCQKLAELAKKPSLGWERDEGIYMELLKELSPTLRKYCLLQNRPEKLHT